MALKRPWIARSIILNLGGGSDAEEKLCSKSGNAQTIARIQACIEACGDCDVNCAAAALMRLDVLRVLSAGSSACTACMAGKYSNSTGAYAQDYVTILYAI